MNTNQFTSEKHTLELIKLRVQKRVNAAFIKDIQVALSIDQIIADAYTYELQVNILGQSNKQTYKVDVAIPKNWWEHFKLQCFPDWLEKYFPVQFKIVERFVTFDHSRLFPDWEIPQDKGRTVFYTQRPYELGIQNISES